ncbi:hypothetical protein VNO80_06707 [Phaseolus coccineus]|uniref:Uncharacterized protein n=1 Tax=Phaseolus coccineus TaxID=3886 RepID=A0AAN9NHB9_PHACN
MHSTRIEENFLSFKKNFKKFESSILFASLPEWDIRYLSQVQMKNFSRVRGLDSIPSSFPAKVAAVGNEFELDGHKDKVKQLLPFLRIGHDHQSGMLGISANPHIRQCSFPESDRTGSLRRARGRPVLKHKAFTQIGKQEGFDAGIPLLESSRKGIRFIWLFRIPYRSFLILKGFMYFLLDDSFH